MKARWIKALTTRPHRCRMGCTRGFASASARDYHHRSFHKKIKYPCRWIVCNKDFTSIYQLRKHIRRGHPSLTAIIQSNEEKGFFKIIPITE